MAPTSIHGHLRDEELEWINFDPTEFAALARAQEPDRLDVIAGLQTLTKAAWSCRAYLQFAPAHQKTEGGMTLSTPDEVYFFDLDSAGRPLGVELYSVLVGESDH